VLDIINTNAKTGWKRPIHFTTMTSNSVYLGLDDYLRLEGLTYQLLPLKGKPQIKGLTDPDLIYDKLMNVFEWGRIDEGKMHLDDKATLVPINLQRRFLQLSDLYIAQGNKVKAKALLDKCMEVLPESVLPMDIRFKVYFIRDYFRVGEQEKGMDMLRDLADDAEKRVQYYKRFKGKHKKAASNKLQEALSVIAECGRIAQQYSEDKEFTEDLENILKDYR
jgi:hypothetical protein